jgi:hypothetical protein
MVLESIELIQKGNEFYTSEGVQITELQVLDTILHGKNVKISNEDGEDCTSNTLIRIIANHKTSLTGSIPAEFLHFMLRCSPEALEMLFNEYLPPALQFFQTHYMALKQRCSSFPISELSFGLGEFYFPWVQGNWGEEHHQSNNSRDMQNMQERITELENELKKITNKA